jgi:antitoxin PrlF
MPRFRGILQPNEREAAVTIKVANDGQVTIPRQMLQQLGVGPGNEVDVRRSANGTLVIEKVETEKPLDPDRFEKLRGTADAGFSTDEIMAMTRGE